MKWRKLGRLLIRSKKPGTRKRISRLCTFILLVRGARTKSTNYSRAMAARGGDYEIRPTLNMPTVTENFSIGLPVDVSKIETELKKLWQQGEGVMTCASLINLAVYSEATDALTKNTQLVAQITQNHACRAIVIGAHPEAKENHVDAWIS